jgi:hypothetical protein
LQDYNPLSSRRLAAYLYAVAGAPPPEADAPDLFLGWIASARSIRRPALLDMAAVRVVVAKNAPPPRVPPFRRLGGGGRWSVYENPSALPRAFVVEAARFVDDDAAAMAAIVAPSFDPRRAVVLTGAASTDADAAVAARAAGGARPATIVVDDPEHVVVRAHADVASVVVLTDAVAPGWSAAVDGGATPLRPANVLGRGVVVPAGDVAVTFTYHAPGLAWGIALATIAWGAVLVVLVARQARRATSTVSQSEK